MPAPNSGTGRQARRGSGAFLLLLAAPALLAASSSKKKGEEEAPPAEPTTGSITGSVRYQGEEIEGERIDMPRALRSMCGVFKRPDPFDVDRRSALRNAVVSVLDAPAGGATTQQRFVSLTMRRCEWSPRVAAATVGQVLDIHNRDDAVLRPRLQWQGHGNSTDHVYRIQQLHVPRKGQHVATRLGGSGTLQVSCDDVRPWALSTIRVFDHPFHAVTDDKGNFTIEGLPPGTYRLVAWDRTLGETTTSATVSLGKSTSVAFLFDPERQRKEVEEAEAAALAEAEAEAAAEAAAEEAAEAERLKAEAAKAAAEAKAKPEPKPEAKPKPEVKPEAEPKAKKKAKPEAKPAEG